MKVYFVPKNYLGKWSLALIIIMPMLFCLGMNFVDYYDSIPAGRTILQDIINRPGIALPMLTGFTTGIAGFIIGLIAIVRKKERAILVFLSTAIGFMVLLWVFAEILFPH